MKKLTSFAGVTVLLALLVAPQPATADILDLTAGTFPDGQLASLSSSGDPFAVGGGITGVSQTHFAFSARLGPNGPSGYAVVTSAGLGGGKAQGHVVCFSSPAPQVAEFGIVIEKAAGFFAALGFEFVTVLVADGGEPSQGAGTDGLSLFADAASPCTTDIPVGGGPVIQGNIVVKS